MSKSMLIVICIIFGFKFLVLLIGTLLNINKILNKDEETN